MLLFILRSRASTIRRCLFAAALSAVAAGIYVALPAEPRWTLVQEPSAAFSAFDGRVATYRYNDGLGTGPLLLCDAGTGKKTRQFLSSDITFRARATSRDGQIFVAVAIGERPELRRICGVDLKEEREWCVDVPVLGPFQSATFSPDCDFVALRLKLPSDEEDAYVIVETASGRLVAQVDLPSPAGHVSFGRCFVVGYHIDDTHHIRIVDPRTGDVAQLDDASIQAVSLDSHWVIADRGDDGIWLGEVGGSWRRQLKQAQLPRQPHVVDLALGGKVIAARVRLAIMKYQTSTIKLWSRGGRLLHVGYHNEDPVFAPDSRTLLASERLESGQWQLTLLDVQTAKPLWQRKWTEKRGDFQFTPDCKHIVVVFADEGRIELLDAGTGEIERTFAVNGLSDLDARVARDGRSLVVIGAPPEEQRHWLSQKVLDWIAPRPEVEAMVLTVFDIETGVELGSLSADSTDEHWLSADRLGLITVDQEHGENQAAVTLIRCWDLPPRKPLRWVLAGTMAVGFALLSLGFAWRRLRTRRSPATRAPVPEVLGRGSNMPP